MHSASDHDYGVGELESRSHAFCLRRAGDCRRLAMQALKEGRSAHAVRLLGFWYEWMKEARWYRTQREERRRLAMFAASVLP